MSKKNSFLEEQNYALEHSGKNLIVSASAGSGKTTVLIAKLAELLAGGADITRMVVMTFTRMAAEEMKERLADKVAELMRDNPEARENLSKNLANLPFANITTIDGFCADLFKRWFNELGEDSQYAIIENDDERNAIFDKAADTVINRKYAENKDGFRDLCEAFAERRTAGGLKKAVRAICAFWEVQPDSKECIQRAYEEFSKPIDGRKSVLYILSTARKRSAELYDLLNNAEMRIRSLGETCLSDNITEHKDANLRIKDAATLEEFFGQLGRIAPFTSKSSKKAKTPEGAELREEISELLSASKEHVAELQKRYNDYGRAVREELESSKFAALLFETALDVAAEYNVLKHNENKLDFADLERFALRILSDAARREEIRNSIDYIFLDEYQDTNYLQEEIIKGISRGDNVFMVGDVKQCIYRFRAAEPQIFIDKYRNYSEKRGGDSVAFNKNWRSSPRILEFVNGVMSEIMTASFGGVDYRDEAQLISATEDYPVVSDLPEAFFARKSKIKSSRPKPVLSDGYDIRQATAKPKIKRDEEAEYIAETIEETVGKRMIWDAKRGEKRLVGYGDIAVLVRRNKDCDSVAAELRRHKIPVYQCADNKDFYAGDRTCLIDYLRLIDNSQNDMPLISVLLSPIGNFNDRELFEIRKSDKKNPFWYTFFNYNGSPKLENKIKEFTALLEKHRLMSASTDVFSLLTAVSGDFRFDAYVMGCDSGSERIERHNMFLASLEGKDFAATVADFLEYAENADFSVQPPASDASAVSVMSVHKSKGLEFPMVFLAHTSYRSNFGRTDISLDRDFGIALRFFDRAEKVKRETISTFAFGDKKERAEREDEMRLLYVAMTRAKNHLIVTGKESSSKPLFADRLKQFGQFLDFAAEKNAKIKNSISELETEEKSEAEAVFAEIPERGEFDFDALNRRYAYAPATVARAKYAVSAVSETDAREDAPSPPKVMFEAGEDKIRAGIICHAVMERVDFSKRNREAVIDAADSLFADGTITAEERENIDVDMLARVLSLDVFGIAAKSKAEREKSFMLFVPHCEIYAGSGISDRVLVQGVIDLLITGAENIVVDYKYTASPPETVKKRYAKQLALYSDAFEKITGRKIDRRVIVLLRTAETVEV